MPLNTRRAEARAVVPGHLRKILTDKEGEKEGRKRGRTFKTLFLHDYGKLIYHPESVSKIYWKRLSYIISQILSVPTYTNS